MSICGKLFASWNPNGSSAWVISQENARVKQSPILGRASARFYIRARLALLQTMTGPASPRRNCATWAYGSKNLKKRVNLNDHKQLMMQKLAACENLNGCRCGWAARESALGCGDALLVRLV